MKIDYEFISQMLTKYYKHLQSVEKSIESAIEDYDRQINSLQNLPKYKNRLVELEDKKTEAFIKLSSIVPNMNKINEQKLLLEEKII